MRTILFTLALVFVGVPACWAQGIATSPPVYNPATKSYFQLVENQYHSYVWDKAQAEARTKIYKGVAGRLAVVDSPETHEFLVDHFDLRDPRKAIWIGLRYWCKPPRLHARLLRHGRQFGPLAGHHSLQGVSLLSGGVPHRTGIERPLRAAEKRHQPAREMIS